MIDGYVAQYRRRELDKAVQKKMLAVSTFEKLRKSIPIFIRNFESIKRIILFGSLAEGKFGHDSDIDLYVDGLAPGEYFKALHQMENLLQHSVEIYTCGDSKELIQKIFDRGVVVYEYQPIDLRHSR